MATTTAGNTLVQRLIGAAALDSAIYEEVEADESATGQALLIVVLSSICVGVGASGLGGGATMANIGVMTGVALIAWAAWALETYEIGRRLMPEPQTRVDVGQLLRTIGFAATPAFICLLGIIPAAAVPAFAVAAVWMLLAMIVAVRQALDYTTTRHAIAVCLLGWALALAIALTLGIAFGPTVS